MKKFALAFLLMFGLVGYAAAGCSDIHVTGMEKADLEQLRLECQKKQAAKAAQEVTGVLTPEQTELEIKKWTQYGQFASEIAQAIGVLAKELNMAVNEFLTTDAGKLAAGMLLWKVFGDDVVGIGDAFLGLVLLCLLYKVTRFAINRLWPRDYEERKKKIFFGLLGEKTVRVPVYVRYRDISEGEALFSILTFAAGCIGALTIVGNFF